MNTVPTFLLTSTSPKYFGCVFCPDVLFLPWAVSWLDYARFESKQKRTPSSRIWTSDLWISALFPTTVHRSTNWAIEGLTSNLVHNTQVTLIGWQWPSKPELCWYRLSTLLAFHTEGDVAQMVERSLSMWEVGGSIPPVSKFFSLNILSFGKGKLVNSRQTA